MDKKITAYDFILKKVKGTLPPTVEQVESWLIEFSKLKNKEFCKIISKRFANDEDKKKLSGCLSNFNIK